MGAVRRMGSAATAVAVFALAGCANASGSGPPDDSLPWPSGLASPGSPLPPGPTDTPSPPPPAFPRPADAASHLLDAWLAGNRLEAEQVALPAAVTTLFAVDPKTQTWFFAGCSTETECDFNAAHEVAKLIMAPDTENGGYLVIGVEFGGAG